ncbi:hypothetical protein L0244_23820 [bacterium]|nr:hypothetical protein [bacterium]
MSIKNLSNEDQTIILECMKCILEGPYISDVELPTRLGINRSELKKITECWPDIDDFRSDSSAYLAVNNCLNEVCHGISFSNDDWSVWFKTTRSEVRNIYNRWAKSVG